MAGKTAVVHVRKGRMERAEALTAYLFVSPWVVGFLTFVVFPLVMSVMLSFTSWDLTPPVFEKAKFIGLKNFEKLFNDRLFWKSLQVTVLYALMRVPVGIFFGLLLAVVLNNEAVKGKSFFRVFYYLPAVLPPVGISLMWTWIFTSDGVLNTVLNMVGIKPLGWIADPNMVLISFLIMAIWSLMGKNMLVYLAGLNSIPPQLVESAYIDGATTWQTFMKIKLPMVSPVIFYELVMTMIESFKMFTQAYVMTRGGPQNASLFYVYYLYKTVFDYRDAGYGSALAWVLFVVILAFTLVIFSTSKKWVYYEADGK